MFGPGYTAGCPVLLGDRGRLHFVVHLANHDVTLCAVWRAPLAKLQTYKRRMGWSFSWASSFGSDFNYDFQAAHTKEQQQSGAGEHNFRAIDMRPEWQASREELPGMSAFALEDGGVYCTYSAYARGLEGLWGMYQGSIARHAGTTRPLTGGAATTSTTASDACGRGDTSALPARFRRPHHLMKGRRRWNAPPGHLGGPPRGS